MRRCVVMKKIMAIAIVAMAGMLAVGIPAQATLSDGLVGYYPFNANADDESGNGNTGIAYGAALTSDRFGSMDSAYVFDGSGDYIQVGNSDSLDMNSGMTISAWVYFDVDPYSISASKSRSYVVDKYYAYRLWYSSDGEGTSEPDNFFFDIWDWQGPVTQNITWEAGKWYHIVATYDGSTGKIYVDGLLNNQTSVTKTLKTSGYDFYIGMGGDCSGCGFEGMIDDVRIYNRALTDPEIDQLYTETSAGTATGDDDGDDTSGSSGSIEWTDWISADTGIVTGTMGDVDVTYTGDYYSADLGTATNYWTEGTPAPYTDNAVVDTAPTAGELIRLVYDATNKIEFSEPVLDPVMAIVSMGQSSTPVTYDFDQPFTVLSEGKGYWGDGTYTLDDADSMTGKEFHGAIQFSGWISEINFTSTYENWHGFTFGAPSSGQDNGDDGSDDGDDDGSDDPGGSTGADQISILSPSDNEAIGFGSSGGKVTFSFSKITDAAKYVLHLSLYDILTDLSIPVPVELIPPGTASGSSWTGSTTTGTPGFSEQFIGMFYELALDSATWNVLALYDIQWGVEAYDDDGNLIGSTFPGATNPYVYGLKFIASNSITMTSPLNGASLDKTDDAPTFQWETYQGVSTYLLVLAHVGSLGFDTVITQDNLTLTLFPMDAAAWQTMPTGDWYWAVFGYDSTGNQTPGDFTIFEFEVQ